MIPCNSKLVFILSQIIKYAIQKTIFKPEDWI